MKGGVVVIKHLPQQMKKSGKSFFQHCREVAAQSKHASKPKLSIVALKKAKALVEADGMMVTGLTVNRDGSFRLELGVQAEQASANEWDVVLK
jgi:phage tail sheath gpL-like